MKVINIRAGTPYAHWPHHIHCHPRVHRCRVVLVAAVWAVAVAMWIVVVVARGWGGAVVVVVVVRNKVELQVQ